jgi:hypothetical protein
VESGAFGRVPFVVIAVAVGVMAFGFVALGYELKLGIYSLALLAIPLVVAMAYLSQYSRRPYEPWVAPGSGETDDPSDEPFDDPVEEADRISGGPTRSDGAATTADLEPPGAGGQSDGAPPGS